VASADVSALEHLLTPDERRRAGRFRFLKDQERFRACRGRLRVILGHYLGRPPEELRFAYGRHGKPALALGSGDDSLCFNLAHTEGMVLYGVTVGRDVGIDVERLRADVACLQIAEQFFSPREVASLRALPPALQEAAFFKCWTCKEAYLKARGEGLAFPLHEFDVSLVPGEPAALLRTNQDPREAARWSIKELTPGPGYAAALAVEGRDWRLACWQWPEDGHWYARPVDERPSGGKTGSLQ
jgi:4'-phosphopantetheinyl transferase